MKLICQGLKNVSKVTLIGQGHLRFLYAAVNGSYVPLVRLYH
jgi:hypothetical protein